MKLVLLLPFVVDSGITPPTSLFAKDTPNDRGNSITVEWKLSKDDKILDGYEIFRREEGDTVWKKVGWTPRGCSVYVDKQEEYRGKIINEVKNEAKYFYKIRGRSRDTYTFFVETTTPAIPSPQWFNRENIPVLIGVFLLFSSFFTFISLAKRGTKLYIRKIAGLDALDEAVGRSTEMGKPLLYVPGLSTMSDVATIASINILERVAKKTAEYGVRLLVPNRSPIVLTVIKQVVKEAYNAVGRPDLFRDEDIMFVSDDQFAFASGVSGIMAREKPGTNLFIGMFWAESLILAESGSATGAIQIAGTDAITQLPFFITACDYTIIGEELYAASAYLSEEPILVGSVKAQDLLKIIILGMLMVGSIFFLLGNNIIVNIFKV